MSQTHTHKRAPGASYSWRRAIGLSALLGRISRKIGVPLTRSGREQKAGRLVLKAAGGLILLAVAAGYYAVTHPDALQQIIAVVRAAGVSA